MAHLDRSCQRRAEMSHEIFTKAEIDTGIKQLDGWTVYTDGNQPRLRKHNYFHDLMQPLGL